MEDLLTSSEARELLGNMSPSSFKELVDNDRIRKVVAPGKTQGKYVREDVEKIAKELLSYGKSRKPVKRPTNQQKEIIQPFVDWVGVDDVLTSLQLDYRVYGPEVFLADLQYYADRVVKNPQVALAVFDSPKRERILAYISLIPLQESVILEILSGKRHETKIATEEVESYNRKGGFTLLAESVVTDPEHPEQLNTLLRHFTQHWCEQYPDRYVTKIYAQAESDEGDILIQKLFFAPREDLAPNAYVLNLARPGASRFVRQFQQCIEEKRKALGL